MKHRGRKWFRLSGRLCHEERGVSLLTSILIGLILSALGYATIHAVISDSIISANHAKGIQAFWIAEAGVERTLNYLRFADPPPGGTAPFFHAQNVPVGAGTYTVEIDPDDNNAASYLKAYKITVTGTIEDISRSIEIHVRTATFGKYAYMTGDEGQGVIWFTSADLIEGPVHSNDQIAITGRPTFMGKVTSSANSFRRGSGYNPDFREGYQLGVPPVAFPTLQNVLDNFLLENGNSATPFDIDARFNRDAEIHFNADGTMTYSVWRQRRHGRREYIIQNQVVPLSATNGLINLRGDVNISGTINGRVTLIASDNIYIADDLRYSDSDANGRPSGSSTNLLGLVSVKNVVIKDNAANRDNVVINAAILTLGTSFTVENYWRGSPRGNLTVYGSISQKVRGPVGTFSWWGTTGYAKDYHYDERFSSQPPPYYPITGQYDTSGWREITQ